MAAGWRSGPLRVARTRSERFGGLRPRAHGRGLLLAARSVHSFGMAEPLRVISLDAFGRVRRVARLLPGRVFFDPGARWVVELPAGRPAPPVGMALQVVTRPSPGAGGRVCWHT